MRFWNRNFQKSSSGDYISFLSTARFSLTFLGKTEILDFDGVLDNETQIENFLNNKVKLFQPVKHLNKKSDSVLMVPVPLILPLILGRTPFTLKLPST